MKLIKGGFIFLALAVVDRLDARKICYDMTDPKLAGKKQECLNISHKLRQAEISCNHQNKKNQRRIARNRQPKPISEGQIDQCKIKEGFQEQMKNIIRYYLVHEGYLPPNHPCSIYFRKDEVLECVATHKAIPKLRTKCRAERDNHEKLGINCQSYSTALASIPKKKSPKGQCAWHHHHFENFCLPNICNCENGLAVSSQRCSEHLANECFSCDENFHLDKGVCKSNKVYNNLLGVNKFLNETENGNGTKLAMRSAAEQIISSPKTYSKTFMPRATPNGPDETSLQTRHEIMMSQNFMDMLKNKVDSKENCVTYHVSNGVHFWNQGGHSAEEYCASKGWRMATVRSKKEMKMLDTGQSPFDAKRFV